MSKFKTRFKYFIIITILAIAFISFKYDGDAAFSTTKSLMKTIFPKLVEIETPLLPAILWAVWKKEISLLPTLKLEVGSTIWKSNLISFLICLVNISSMA